MVIRSNFHRYLSSFLAIGLLTLMGCNGSSSGGGIGTLNLSIADTPVDGATSVIVTFTGVEIQPAGGEEDQRDSMDMGEMDDSDEDTSGSNKPLEFDFATPRHIDLMQQQGGNSASILSGVSLPAGRYAWIRLKVDASQSSITLTDGSVHPLT